MNDKRTEGEGAAAGWSSDGVSRLVRLKRHECPEGGHELYVERFVEEFRERQRAELLRTSARGLLWERLSTYVGAMGAGSEARQSRLAWGGFGLAAVACVAFVLVVVGDKPEGETGQGGAVAAQQGAAGAAGAAGGGTVDGVASAAILMAASAAADGEGSGNGGRVPVSAGPDGGMGESGMVAMPYRRGLNYSMGWEAGLSEGAASVVPCEWGMPEAGRGWAGSRADGETFSAGIWDEEEWKELARDLLEGMGEGRGGVVPWGDVE